MVPERCAHPRGATDLRLPRASLAPGRLACGHQALLRRSHAALGSSWALSLTLTQLDKCAIHVARILSAGHFGVDAADDRHGIGPRPQTSAPKYRGEGLALAGTAGQAGDGHGSAVSLTGKSRSFGRSPALAAVPVAGGHACCRR